MRLRDLLKRWYGGAAIAALVWLILGAGLCCLDQGPGMDDHAMLMELCFLMLLVPALILPLAGLLPRGLTVNFGGPALAPVPLAVPKPPPRRIRFA